MNAGFVVEDEFAVAGVAVAGVAVAVGAAAVVDELDQFSAAVVFLTESAAAVVERVTRGILGFVCGA